MIGPLKALLFPIFLAFVGHRRNGQTQKSFWLWHYLCHFMKRDMTSNACQFWSYWYKIYISTTVGDLKAIHQNFFHNEILFPKPQLWYIKPIAISIKIVNHKKEKTTWWCQDRRRSLIVIIIIIIRVHLLSISINSSSLSVVRETSSLTDKLLICALYFYASKSNMTLEMIIYIQI